MSDKMSQEEQNRIFDMALKGPFQRVYANGFGVAASLTEFAIVFQLQEQPAMTVMVPFSVAKSLAAALTESLGNIEKKLGAIPDMDGLRAIFTTNE